MNVLPAMIHARSGGNAAAVGVLLMTLLAFKPDSSWAADNKLTTTPGSKLITNYVLVTNMVIVTNYVITTNIVLTTNAPIAQPPRPLLPDLSWVPPADGFDWIQLKSGEWLKGRLKAMQDRKLEFDSEELELLTFDWKDIRQLRSPRIHELLFEKEGELSGPIVVTPHEVTVGHLAPETFPRIDLLSIAPGGARERNHWSGKLSLGLTLHSGNTTSVDYNAQMTLQRRTPSTRLAIDYLGNINSLDDETTANNHRVNAEFDLWLSRRLYLIVPLAEYFKDPFQNIANRFTLGVGVGYYIFDRPGLSWNVSSGPAYQKTWFESVQAGEPTESAAGALTFGSEFDWEITHRVDLILEYRGQYTRKDVGETFHHGVATLEVELTKRFDLDVSFIWDRVQNPQAESGGDVPKQDDFRLILGLGLRF